MVKIQNFLEIFMQNDDDKLAGVMVMTTILSSIGVWVGSGYILWDLIGVTGFGKGIMWFIAWSLVGGIAQSIIAPIISMALIAFLSIFMGNR